MADRRPRVRSFDPFSGPPRFNGARRVGIRPGTPVTHPIAVSGTRPLHFEVSGLPAGLAIDDEGIVRGTAPAEPGDHTIEVFVSNPDGMVSNMFDLCVGDDLALTPPMGWNSWNVYASEITADVVIRTAQAMVESGMRDLGYQFVNIDDHWHAAARWGDGSPRANPVTFPDGIEAVADAVHALVLKLGIYSDAAHLTCGNCFGGYEHERVDARSYAKWGVDLLKYDYCHAPKDRAAALSRYEEMSRALQGCGRSIVFSVCEWGFRKPWLWAPGIGASFWRTTPDIFDSFSWGIFGVRGIARRNMRLAEHAGPGRWNDPDMLLVGNHGTGKATGQLKTPKGRRLRTFRGISDVQAHTHMTLWAMMAAPLLASHDLAASNEFDLSLLTNPDVLSVNQDPLGHQARRVRSAPGLWILQKNLADGGIAVSISNMGGPARRVRYQLEPPAELGVVRSIDAWTGEVLSDTGRIDCRLRRHESVMAIARPIAAR